MFYRSLDSPKLWNGTCFAVKFFPPTFRHVTKPIMYGQKYDVFLLKNPTNPIGSDRIHDLGFDLTVSSGQFYQRRESDFSILSKVTPNILQSWEKLEAIKEKEIVSSERRKYMKQLPGESRNNSLAIRRLSGYKYQRHAYESWNLFDKGK